MFLATGLSVYIVSKWWGSAVWWRAALVCFQMVLCFLDLSSAASVWTWILKSSSASTCLDLATSSACACFRLKSNENWGEEGRRGRGKTFLNFLSVLQVCNFGEKLNRQRLHKLRKKKKTKPHITSVTCPQQSQALKEDYSANTYIIGVVWIPCLISFLSHWPGFIRLAIKLLSQLCGGRPGIYYFSSSFQVFRIKVWFWLAFVSLHFSPLVIWRNNHGGIILSSVCPCIYPHVI